MKNLKPYCHLREAVEANGVKGNRDRERELAIGIEIELESTPDVDEARAKALANIKSNPEYYSSEAYGKGVDADKALKAYKKISEGDWWDSDPSAPWNQDDGPEPEASIEYPVAQQAFKYLTDAGDEALLKKKDDGTLWLLDVMDILDPSGEFEDYVYMIQQSEDDREVADGMEEESYINISTDLYKRKMYNEDPELDWDDRDFDVKLYMVTPKLAEHLIEDYLYYSKGNRKDMPTWRRSNEKTQRKYREMANILSRAFPESA